MFRKSTVIKWKIAILFILCGYFIGCSDNHRAINLESPNSTDLASSQICYLSTESGVWKIKTLNPANDSIAEITNIGGTAVKGLAWSPDKSRLVFASDRVGSMQIWIINNDGSNLSQVTGIEKSLSEISCYYPCWEDSNHLLFTILTGENEHPEIGRIRTDGSQFENLIIYNNAPYCYSAPGLSDDLTGFACRIAVPVDTEQSSILITNYPNLGNKHIVSVPGQKAGNPKWSANGLLAYDEAVSGIYTVLPSGTQLINISGPEHPGDCLPVFSTDGGRIAFLADDSGIKNIFIMNLDGTNRQQKTDVTSGEIISDLDW